MYQIMNRTRPDDSPVALLFQRHAQVILTYLHQRTRTKEDADDILLEVFLAAIENQELLCLGEGEQRAWLRRVAHNKAIDFYRSPAHRKSSPLNEAAHLFSEEDRFEPERVVLRQEDEGLLRARLATLPEPQQEVLWLRFAWGMRTKEIARLVGKNDGAVRMTLSRALNFLRGIYDQQEGTLDNEAR